LNVSWTSANNTLLPRRSQTAAADPEQTFAADCGAQGLPVSFLTLSTSFAESAMRANPAEFSATACKPPSGTKPVIAVGVALFQG
jgi:hypothetical protein